MGWPRLRPRKNLTSCPGLVDHYKEIQALALARFKKVSAEAPANGVTWSAAEAVASIGRPHSVEEIALEEAMESLSQPEALDLVALMYVGRGDYIEDFENKQEIVEAYEAQLKAFSTTSTEELARICYEKDLVLHDYLSVGIERLRG